MRGRPRPRGGCWNCLTRDSLVRTSRWKRTVVTCCPVILASSWASRGSLAPRRIASSRRRGHESDIAHPSSRETLSDARAIYSPNQPICDLKRDSSSRHTYHALCDSDTALPPPTSCEGSLTCPSPRTPLPPSVPTHTHNDS